MRVVRSILFSMACFAMLALLAGSGFVVFFGALAFFDVIEWHGDVGTIVALLLLPIVPCGIIFGICEANK